MICIVSRNILLLPPIVALVLIARETALFPTLASTAPLGRQPEGFYLLPTNQLLRPWGEQTLLKDARSTSRLIPTNV